ncbi:MAG: Nramp family divalent metal transporter [Paludibacterium sp.]|uniref:Nramp family divalent metal transporter n=1 Tax=Paludibacterium sp. TaxID=1917523 RepID=UPI0025FCAC4D|nr:Nramp family divalent metal transporter [Paludibacterium sp.]MBV8049165.1 Nramp family divalent metal transporter [Paludibacterium sp.]MBV8649304.1 Nramp family divalent metal transporter [Paludibacterium sp.]
MAASPALARLRRAATVFGPGLVVMLADTDAGSVITAAQSGAQWGYRLLLLQFLIIPLLYVVQELTVRLALCTGKGYGELVRQRFGRWMALVAMATLIISCFGALVTEISGLTGAGQLFGIAPWKTIVAVCALILFMVCTGSYQSVERGALAIGAFELAFLVVAWHAHPDWSQVRRQLTEMPFGNRDYLYLLAANLGTSIMPWTVFYQQSALIDKGLGQDQLKAARLDTLIGAALCQVVTASVLIAAAAAFGSRGGGMLLDSVPQIAEAFTAVLGRQTGVVLFAMALSGGALVATIVVCLATAWAVGEVTGKRHSLALHPFEAPWFYGAFALMLIVGGLLVGSGVNLVRLMLATGVVNALLLPVVLGFLFWLAWRELPAAHRLRGAGAVTVGLLFAATACLGLYTGIQGALG